jgi:hypothetical protein
MAAGVRAKGRSGDPELLPEAAPHAAGMKLSLASPSADRQCGIGKKIGCKHPRPVISARRDDHRPFDERRRSLAEIPFGEARDRIRVFYVSHEMGRGIIAQTKRQDHGSSGLEAVEMTLIRPMEDDVAGADPVQSRIAGFDVAAGEDDGCIGHVVPMTI